MSWTEILSFFKQSHQIKADKKQHSFSIFLVLHTYNNEMKVSQRTVIQL